MTQLELFPDWDVEYDDKDILEPNEIETDRNCRWIVLNGIGTSVPVQGNL